MSMKDYPPLLTPLEAMEMTGLDRHIIQRWRKRGNVTTVQINGRTFLERESVLKAVARRERALYEKRQLNV